MSDYFRQNSIVVTGFNPESGWVIMSSVEARIKAKIEEMGVPLKDWDVQINYGIKTGFNEAFIIDEKTKDELIKKSPKSAEIIRPILRGKDIQRYNANFSNLWIIFTRKGIDIRNYGAIEGHLKQFYEDLKPKNKGELRGRKPGNYEWYEIQDNIAYWQDFSKPKIIYPEITKFINFFLDDGGFFFTNNKCFILSGHNLEYLTCFFNSKLFRYCFIDNFPELLGGTRELRKIFFEQIPVMKVAESENTLFKNKLNEISILKNKNVNSKEIENEIDNMIYKLYNLDIESIKIINNSDKATL